MIDAEVRSEERFSRLSLAYESPQEKQKVTECITEMTKKYTMTPEIHTTHVSNGKEVLVVEYHDDTCREAGKIFEEILCSLDIRCCN